MSDVGKREEETLKYWQEQKIFEKTLEKPSPKGEFVFYDGPPFATGLPHYGHLLGSTAKDLIPRYKTMRGYHVRRRWGWDTHGLPVENIVEKKLGLKNKKDILDLGIEKFNELCRAQVLEYVHDWKKYVERVGRWVDFDNSYKTMDATYTESVWWALSVLNKKGLLYEGRKVLMYCPHCETPLAKAEIAMDNSYKDVTEEAVTVKFKTKKFTLLAWTTTPWTLPANVALAVGRDIEYAEVEKDGEKFVLANALVEKYFGKDAKVGKTLKGSDLENLEYEALYEIPAIKQTGKKSHYVALADFVNTEEGTGIVHTAVIYGEDDYKLGLEKDLPMVPLLNSNGTYNTDAPEFLQGQYIKKADKIVIEDLENRGLLFAKAPNTHSYPHCYRCGTALIYNALSSWFINIQKIKAEMLELNEKINWVPEHLKHGRFKHIIDNAPDWTISRNRFWASPLPVWKCAGCKKTEIIGGLEELSRRAAKSGNRYILMRHGKAESNGSGRVSDDVSDKNPLTDEGRVEVVESAKKLAKEKIEIIYASDFERTKESAEIVASELGLDPKEIIYDKRLWEMKVSSGGWSNWNDVIELMGKEAYSADMRGGETYHDVRRRVMELMFEIDSKYNNKNILIVTHGIVPLALESGLAKETDTEMNKAETEAWDPKTAEWKEFAFWQFPHRADYRLDLHRPYIDAVKLVCDCGGSMSRIPEVIDCWVESGSMPFAEYHYPFENREQFEKSTPGDYIAEYIAQTRTWFYYMHALATGLWNTPAFKNVITTGTILAADGSKMSKSKGNYSDPLELVDKYGADAYRYYMMSSVVMQAEDLSFRDEDVKDVYQRIVNILWNVVTFYKMYSEDKHEARSTKSETISKSENVLDKWILARLSELHKEVTDGLDAYNTVKAGRPIREFVNDLSTWYIRRSRDRFKSDDAKDREAAMSTTRYVLLELAKILAPFMPFVAEQIYKEMGGELESVHLESWTEVGDSRFTIHDSRIITEMRKTREIVSLALEERQKANIKVRQPLALLRIKNNLPKEYLEVIKDEINVKEVLVREALDTEVALDIALTDELVAEGQMRDLVRSIQEKRKELELKPEDKILVKLPNKLEQTVRLFETEIKKAVNASEISMDGEEIKIERV